MASTAQRLRSTQTPALIGFPEAEVDPLGTGGGGILPASLMAAAAGGGGGRRRRAAVAGGGGAAGGGYAATRGAGSAHDLREQLTDLAMERDVLMRSLALWARESLEE